MLKNSEGETHTQGSYFFANKFKRNEKAGESTQYSTLSFFYGTLTLFRKFKKSCITNTLVCKENNAGELTMKW